MGEVYRARDSSLHRDVAIKLLLPSVANDPDRLARFNREAQALASLNHPHIAQIYGLEKAPGPAGPGSLFIVMEFVDGNELAQTIARGPLPLDEALPIARQIAEALEGAHEQGIIHRDLKPANIKVRPDGTVKVLDFGLAKAAEPALSSSAGVMNSPTLSIHATQAGLILGTAAYMSPEQARGRAVDKRADLWAFGCVLFEMLTGKRAFGGDDVTDTIVSVVSKEPDWAALPAATPPGVRRLLQRTLEKDPKRRLDSAAAARLEIEEARGAAVAPHVAAPVRPGWSVALPWALACVAAAAAAVAWWNGSQRASSTPLYASLDAPSGFVLGEDDSITPLPTRTPIVFTPDGRALIIQAAKDGKPQLFLRPLDHPGARPIAGTEDAHVPFVSPDGKWIGFWTANELRKVPIEGGTPTTICAVKAPLGPHGAAWSAADVIVFGDYESARLMRVPATGGTPALLTPAPGLQRRHLSPFFLPDGRRVLYSDAAITDASDVRLMVQSLDGGEPKLVLASASDGRVLPSGQLAFMRLGTLMTVPFDASRAETKGDAVAALGSVMQSGVRGRLGADIGPGMFAVSKQGALAAIRGPLTGSVPSALIWVDQQGRETSADPTSTGPAGGNLWQRISPNGSRAIIAVQTPMHREIWFADWSRDLWTKCDSCPATFTSGVWSRDGRRIVMTTKTALVVHTVDGSATDEELMHEDGRVLLPTQWLADGRVVYESSADFSSFEIKVLDPGSHTGRVVTPMGTGSEPDVSPDGRWLAYTSREGVVMVQAFPGPGAKTQVSAGSGSNGAWSPDGRTLYYLARASPGAPSTMMMAVDIRSGSAIDAGRPRELFQRLESQRCGIMRCFDVSPDGSRFLLRGRSAKHESVDRLDLVLNWTTTLPR
jgi:Tol biopolymer transport system component